MPRKSQDHVHRLIRSMTRAEKRYFKLFTSRGPVEEPSSNHLLFDAIAAMEQYDEPALMRKFKDEAFTRRFAITKRRLYESILKSLDANHAESSVDARLHRLLHQVELLHQRALYEDSEKMLQSVRRLAEEHGRAPALLAAAEWERRLIECRNYAGVSEARLDDLLEVVSDARSSQADIDVLWDLKSRLLMMLYRDGQARDAETRAKVAAMLDHPLLREENQLTTPKARFYFHHLHGAAAFAIGDMETCHVHLARNLELLNKERRRFIDEPNLVLGVMSNLIYACIRSGRYAEASKLLKAFRLVPGQWNMPESDDLDLKLFSTTTSLELSIHSGLGEFSKALELAPVVERGLVKHAERLGPVRKAGLHYQMAYAAFGAGQHERALHWLNELLNQVRLDDSSDTVCFGRMLQLLALYEVGKLDLLAYTLRNTERFLRLRERKYRFEPLFLQLIRNLLKSAKGADRDKHLDDFREALVQLMQDPLERSVLDHFDPIAWVEGKRSGTAYSEVVRARAMSVQNAA